ncbi:MAG: phytanoyl-CoA dioxygenase family protein [Reyranellaceae bacterium]
MPKLVSDTDIAKYERDGFHFPVRVFPSEKAAYYQQCVAEMRANLGGTISKAHAQKSNLLFKWVDELVHEPLLLDAVEDLIGPNLLLWSTEFFFKDPGDKRFVSWHQDDTYWHLEPAIEVTAWIAVSDVPEQAGPVRFIKGSHTASRYKIVNQPDANNMLQSGQIAQGVNEEDAVSAVLKAGEASFHHTRTLHASRPNTSSFARIGVAARFIPTHVRQLNARESAMLMRGTDQYGYFDLEPRPAADMDAAAVEAHRDAVARHMGNLQGQNYQAGIS